MAQLELPIRIEWDDIEEDLAKGNIVKVIRCKDCTHKEDCQWYYYSDDDYGYCKWAERKEE